MLEIDDQPLAAADLNGHVQPGSLQERLRKRREALEADTVKTLDIPGYVGVLAASYRPLGWTVRRKIGARAEKDAVEETLVEIYAAADQLIHACIELVEVLPDGTHRPTGYKWGTRAAVDLFGIDPAAAGDTARQSLFACFPADRDGMVMSHFTEFASWNATASPDIEKALEGESEAGSTGT